MGLTGYTRRLEDWASAVRCDDWPEWANATATAITIHSKGGAS
jgi:hypothetical protein